ncbi:DMT family transporter [Bacillus sp. AFS088145]|uniref:DMT family transporter n=1 Tax=Bacillus sp. AFS088145 TaxID=2033514 RepID=UPI000BF38957|nr:DMT family transporter [Bacillus sp. AFS088145]PFH88711.1 EamA family transporter [Bacillus sp. AFS088145]
MTDKRKAYLAITICSLIIGLSFLFVKQTLTIATPLDTLAHRFTMAWIVATVILFLKKERIKIKKKDFVKITLLSTFYPVLFFGLQIFGLMHTTSSEAGVIQATVPIFTLILASILLKESSTGVQKISILISVLGVMFIMYMNGAKNINPSILGSILILLSALANAIYNVLTKKIIQQYSLFTITYTITFIGFIVFNSIALFIHLKNGTIQQIILPFKQIDFIIAILYLGIFSSLGSSYLSNYALSKLPAFQISIFQNLSTLVTILLGIKYLNESFQYYHIIGSFLIISGVVGVNYFRKKEIQDNHLLEEKQHKTMT